MAIIDISLPRRRRNFGVAFQPRLEVLEARMPFRCCADRDATGGAFLDAGERGVDRCDGRSKGTISFVGTGRKPTWSRSAAGDHRLDTQRFAGESDAMVDRGGV